MKTLNTNLIKLTELLSDGKYHDGTSIGNHLNITRAAVWKVIHKLKQYDIALSSVKGKGYQLESPLLLMDPLKIKKQLRHRSIELDVLEKTPSTNDYLKQLIKDNKKIRVCLAETQTQGKGRLDRGWHSPFGENVYFSMLCPFEKDLSELSGLSLVVSLAICHAIESCFDIKDHSLKVKWPNDILLNQKKLAGILIEVQAESNGYCQVIIGTGINVNMTHVPKKTITQPWTSLLNTTEEYQNRNVLSAAIIDCLIDYFERFSTKGLSAFMDEWRQRDNLINKPISILIRSKKQHGTCVGINDQGHLLLKTKDEEIISFSSGDATLLK
jgi:BirA family transcriptional regulator, biotin operon repressor / biotin---[acetyl-CoA-carboxylase] ligase